MQRDDGLAKITVTGSGSQDSFYVHSGCTWEINGGTMTIFDGTEKYDLTVTDIPSGYEFAYFANRGVKIDTEGDV